MSNFIINRTLNFIINNSNYSKNDLPKLRYGIEGIYLTFSKTLIIIIIGILFKYLDILIITLLLFNILRFFAFGLHAKKSWQCLIMSILEFNVLPLLLNSIILNNSVIFFIGLISFISFLLFAPSDTEKRPLTNKRKRFIRKGFSLIICLIFIIVSFYSDYLSVPIICSLIIESIVINPISYKILGLKYRNYIN